MQRRTFVQASVAGIWAAAAGAAPADEPKADGRELYEHRVYHLKADKQKQLDDYLAKALLPALKRYGVGPVGVFSEKVAPDMMRFHVLIVRSAVEPIDALARRLAADDEHRKAAADYLAARPTDPVYSRIESSLLAPIEGMPKLSRPDASKPRLLNLRVYESHNERASRKKIEMFNKGELAIFKRVGLTPVFFAEVIVGSAMPNLTYLLVFPDEEGRKAAWDRFRVDPEWLKLRAIPEYADKEIVSKITNMILTPASYSEI